MVVQGDQAYLIDAGSLKVASLTESGEVEVLIKPGDKIGEVPVKELLDLALMEDGSLTLLDRSGDVYQYDPGTNGWQVVRLAVEDYTSDRQYLAFLATSDDAFYLMDINRGEVWQQGSDGPQVIWKAPILFEAVDFAVEGEAIFALLSPDQGGSLGKFVAPEYARASDFAPPRDLQDASFLYGDDAYLYVIDQDNQRLLLLDKGSGEMVREYLFRDRLIEIQAVSSVDEIIYIANRDAIYAYPGVTPNPSPPAEISTQPLGPHDSAILSALPKMAWPIEGTALPISYLLPGAPRAYRYGVHEGSDFFWSRGQLVNRETPILAVADGTVVRVDSEYEEPSPAQMEEMLARSREVFHTPADIFDRLRGRQVWLDLGSGVVVYYAHLSRVAPGLEVGQKIAQGQIIGYAGNSGTPEAVQYGPDVGIHLHMEIHIGDGYLGQFLRPAEVGEWLAQVFGF